VEKAQDPPARQKPLADLLRTRQTHGIRETVPVQDAEEVFTEISKVHPSYGGMDYTRLEKPEALHWPCPTKEHPGTPILHKEKFTHPTDWVSSRRSSSNTRPKFRIKTTR